MFQEFYKIQEHPFGVTPDPKYLYPSQTHREALASLVYGIEAGRGFMALIGKPGMGKTTLLFQLLERWGGSAHTIFLSQTQCDSRELLRYLLAELGLETCEQDLLRMHGQLKEALLRETITGKRVVLFIDEAQNLQDSVLETIRTLSNIETPRAKLLQIILCGQPELADTLARPDLAQLRQRIAILSHLDPFASDETDCYIEHRLWVAGYKGGSLFTPDARRIIAERSEGIPRNINNLCFNALTLGYALNRRTIDGSIMNEVVADLDVEKLKPELDLSTPSPLAPSPPPMALQPSKQPMGKWVVGDFPFLAISATLLLSFAVFLSLLFRGSTSDAASSADYNKVEQIVGRPVSPPAITAQDYGRDTPKKTSPSDNPSSADHNKVEQIVDRPVSPPAMTVQDYRRDSPEKTSPSGDPSSADHNKTEQIVGHSQPVSPPTMTVQVRRGDTLEKISQRYLGAFGPDLTKKIRELNPQLRNPKRLQIGQEIRLPRRDALVKNATLPQDSPTRLRRVTHE